MLHDFFGDTTVMKTYYDAMVAYVEYIQRGRVQNNIVNDPLANWVEDDDKTSGRITGTWG